MSQKSFAKVQTPKRTTERLLADTLVRGQWESVKASDLVVALLTEYAPDLDVEWVNPVNFPNPTLTSTFPFVPLGKALADICQYCDVTLDVLDNGTLRFRMLSVEEQLKQALTVDAVLRRTKGEQHV